MPRTKPKPFKPPAGPNVAPNGIGEAPEVLTLEEAASYFRVPADAVLRMIDTDGLLARPFGADWRFNKLRSRLGWEQRDLKAVSLTTSGGSRTILTHKRWSGRFTPDDARPSKNDALPRHGHADPRPLGPSQGRISNRTVRGTECRDDHHHRDRDHSRATRLHPEGGGWRTTPCAQQLLTASEEMLMDIQIFRVDAESAAEFDLLRQMKRLKKTGRADLLIGCITLAHRATLVTRNGDHFRLIPGLKIENWVDRSPRRDPC